MLVYHLDDIVHIVTQLGHVHTQFHQFIVVWVHQKLVLFVPGLAMAWIELTIGVCLFGFVLYYGVVVFLEGAPLDKGRLLAWLRWYDRRALGLSFLCDAPVYPTHWPDWLLFGWVGILGGLSLLRCVIVTSANFVKTLRSFFFHSSIFK